MIRGSLGTVRGAAVALAVGTVASAATSGGAGAAEELTLCWAAWDPANALVELGKDFTAQTGICRRCEFVPWQNFADRIGVIEEGRLLQLASPPINLLPVGVLPAERAPDATATVGVRPEDVSLGAAEGVEGRIEQVEPLGAETVVLVRLASERRMHALTPGLARVEAGSAARVAVAPGAMLFFAADGRQLAA